MSMPLVSCAACVGPTRGETLSHVDLKPPRPRATKPWLALTCAAYLVPPSTSSVDPMMSASCAFGRASSTSSSLPRASLTERVTGRDRASPLSARTSTATSRAPRSSRKLASTDSSLPRRPAPRAAATCSAHPVPSRSLLPSRNAERWLTLPIPAEPVALPRRSGGPPPGDITARPTARLLSSPSLSMRTLASTRGESRSVTCRDASSSVSRRDMNPRLAPCGLPCLTSEAPQESLSALSALRSSDRKPTVTRVLSSGSATRTYARKASAALEKPSEASGCPRSCTSSEAVAWAG
mmetsp:Transcript_37495/g.111244  ORF Transcript_37495/g.111244 Transcript_37495/m.111244 type:complete len:295 (-) Transcript_37495:483-1367(-)